jgi:succinate dehydrogenase / fumarate reductase cytochrome b subunit
MSVAANETGSVPARPSRLALFWDSSIGKKALMALSGLILTLYVVAHLIGNLQIFAGAEAINEYAAWLHSKPAMIWAARIVLLGAVGIHAIAGIQLYMRRSEARPVAYHTRKNIQGTAPSQTMIWSGVLILFFVVFHILDLTTGTVNPRFESLKAYENAVASFSRPLAAIFYVVAMVGLGFHLWHGVYSMFHSLGLTHPRYTPGVRKGAATLATILALGLASIPLFVLLGIVG